MSEEGNVVIARNREADFAGPPVIVVVDDAFSVAPVRNGTDLVAGFFAYNPKASVAQGEQVVGDYEFAVVKANRRTHGDKVRPPAVRRWRLPS